jgi:hypothetical protein
MLLKNLTDRERLSISYSDFFDQTRIFALVESSEAASADPEDDGSGRATKVGS